jgi:hypothetical protein
MERGTWNSSNNGYIITGGWEPSLYINWQWSAAGIHLEPLRRPVENREKMTWRRVNKKLKRILKRREIERQKKEEYTRLFQNP